MDNISLGERRMIIEFDNQSDSYFEISTGI